LGASPALPVTMPSADSCCVPHAPANGEAFAPPTDASSTASSTARQSPHNHLTGQLPKRQQAARQAVAWQAAVKPPGLRRHAASDNLSSTRLWAESRSTVWNVVRSPAKGVDCGQCLQIDRRPPENLCVRGCRKCSSVGSLPIGRDVLRWANAAVHAPAARAYKKRRQLCCSRSSRDATGGSAPGTLVATSLRPDARPSETQPQTQLKLSGLSGLSGLSTVHAEPAGALFCRIENEM